MGQIVGLKAKPKRCNLNKLSQLGTPAAGEYILVSSDNSMNAAGQGNFDCYIVGNGRDAATALELRSISSAYSKEGGVGDLSVTDENLNTIAIFQNGHFQTKEFNSQTTPYADNSDDDFEISDENLNVVLRIKNGDIITKNFNSSQTNKDIIYDRNICISAFVNKMNEYAEEFGMNNTHFLNASGMNENGHYSTAKDIMKLCACCTQYEKLMRYWGMTSYSANIEGEHGRTINVDSTYKGSAMASVGNYYHIYGGKSGTWYVDSTIGNVQNLTLVVKSRVDDAWLVGCIIKSSNSDRGIPFKQLMDWLELYRQDTTTTTPSIEADYAAAGVIPPHNQMSYADVDYCMVSKNGDTQYLPASMTKLMTSLVVLDYCSLDEKFTIESNDIQSGSGSVFYEGDKLSIRDAIPLMLLPSSNTLAVALSRYVGNKIITIKNR